MIFVKFYCNHFNLNIVSQAWCTTCWLLLLNSFDSCIQHGSSYCVILDSCIAYVVVSVLHKNIWDKLSLAKPLYIVRSAFSLKLVCLFHTRWTKQFPESDWSSKSNRQLLFCRTYWLLPLTTSQVLCTSFVHTCIFLQWTEDVFCFCSCFFFFSPCFVCVRVFFFFFFLEVKKLKCDKTGPFLCFYA